MAVQSQDLLTDTFLAESEPENLCQGTLGLQLHTKAQGLKALDISEMTRHDA